MAVIVLVDDDNRLRASTGTILRSVGHEVEMAANGRSGLKIIERANPDLIVTDIVMPELDGLELIRAVRVRNSHIRIVAISERARTGNLDYLDLAMKFGATDTLRKPFSAADLRAMAAKPNVHKPSEFWETALFIESSRAAA